MSAKPNFSKEIRDEIFQAQHGRCLNCGSPIDDFHHRVSNTHTNRQLYPNFIQSVFNCVGLCRSCHDSGDIYKYSIPLGLRAVYEEALKRRSIMRMDDQKMWM